MSCSNVSKKRRGRFRWHLFFKFDINLGLRSFEFKWNDRYIIFTWCDGDDVVGCGKICRVLITRNWTGAKRFSVLIWKSYRKLLVKNLMRTLSSPICVTLWKTLVKFNVERCKQYNFSSQFEMNGSQGHAYIPYTNHKDIIKHTSHEYVIKHDESI